MIAEVLNRSYLESTLDEVAQLLDHSRRDLQSGNAAVALTHKRSPLTIRAVSLEVGGSHGAVIGITECLVPLRKNTAP